GNKQAQSKKELEEEKITPNLLVRDSSRSSDRGLQVAARNPSSPDRLSEILDKRSNGQL
ncbi:hypothetical protein LINGRAHAP2_LOCUS6143, partial [Linum grandiflorum]